MSDDDDDEDVPKKGGGRGRRPAKSAQSIKALLELCVQYKPWYFNGEDARQRWITIRRKLLEKRFYEWESVGYESVRNTAQSHMAHHSVSYKSTASLCITNNRNM